MWIFLSSELSKTKSLKSRERGKLNSSFLKSLKVPIYVLSVYHDVDVDRAILYVMYSSIVVYCAVYSQDILLAM